jgi:hypothetical protein
MTKLLDEAVEILRGLPDSVQTTAARAIIDYASSYGEEVQRALN